MNFKKLSITCLSILFSVMPICSSAMEENFIGSETIYELPYVNVRDLSGAKGASDKEIVDMLVKYFSGCNCFVYDGNDAEIFDKIVTKYLKGQFHYSYNITRYKLPVGAICVYNFDPKNSKVEDWFNLDIRKMLVEVEGDAKLIVINDENLANQFEEAIKKHNENII